MLSGHDHFKGVRGLDVWNLFGIVSTKFMVYFGEELVNFSHVDFFPTEIEAYFQNFLIGLPVEVKRLYCPISHCREGCWRYRPGE